MAIVSAFIKLTLSILLENIPATTFAIRGFVFKEDISPLKVILILEIVFSMIWPPNFPNLKDKSINGLSLGASSWLMGETFIELIITSLFK